MGCLVPSVVQTRCFHHWVVPSQMGFWTAALALHPLLPLVALRLMAVKVFLLAAAWGSPVMFVVLGKMMGIPAKQQ